MVRERFAPSPSSLATTLDGIIKSINNISNIIVTEHIQSPNSHQAISVAILVLAVLGGALTAVTLQQF